MDPEVVGCEAEEEELVRVKRERLMKMVFPKLPRTVGEADVGLSISYATSDFTTARLHLRVIKDWLKGLKSLPPLFEETPDCLSELNYAYMILQYAVLMTISGDEEDPAAFDEEFDQLKPYYAIDVVPLPPGRNQIFGYYLMRLLEKNRIADFQAELKSLSASDIADPYIQRAVKVEKVLSGCPTLDCKLLREAYRDKICGRCCRKSYIHPYVQRVMFSRPREKPLPCVKEEEVIRTANEKRAFLEKKKQSLTGPMMQQEEVLGGSKNRNKSKMSPCRVRDLKFSYEPSMRLAW